MRALTTMVPMRGESREKNGPGTPSRHSSPAHNGAAAYSGGGRIRSDQAAAEVYDGKVTLFWLLAERWLPQTLLA